MNAVESKYFGTEKQSMEVMLAKLRSMINIFKDLDGDDIGLNLDHKRTLYICKENKMAGRLLGEDIKARMRCCFKIYSGERALNIELDKEGAKKMEDYLFENYKV